VSGRGDVAQGVDVSQDLLPAPLAGVVAMKPPRVARLDCLVCSEATGLTEGYLEELRGGLVG
jgi:hypothetical protein